MATLDIISPPNDEVIEILSCKKPVKLDTVYKTQYYSTEEKPLDTKELAGNTLTSKVPTKIDCTGENITFYFLTEVDANPALSDSNTIFTLDPNQSCQIDALFIYGEDYGYNTVFQIESLGTVYYSYPFQKELARQHYTHYFFNCYLRSVLMKGMAQENYPRWLEDHRVSVALRKGTEELPCFGVFHIPTRAKYAKGDNFILALLTEHGALINNRNNLPKRLYRRGYARETLTLF